MSSPSLSRLGLALPLLLQLTSCSLASEPTETPPTTGAEALKWGQGPIVAGSGVGNVRLGMTYREVKDAAGFSLGLAYGGTVIARSVFAGLEIVLGTDSGGFLPPDDATVVSITALRGSGFSGTVKPGMPRAEAKAALGAGHATIGKTEIYPSGISVTYESEKADAKVEFVTVFPSFTPESTPAEMSPSRSKVAPRPTPSATQSLGVVDMHLHPGTVGRFPAKAFRDMVEAVPGFFQPHIPGLLAGLIAPFGPELGILNQAKAAGVQHSVLFAVYTQRSAGFFTNEELEDILTDPRNVAADGLPWAWGLASINFFDGYVNDRGVVNNSVAQSRLKALSSYFEKRRDLFIGIKLAHAHQGIAFDDQRYMGVYDVARKHRAPVYLHTGITPTAPTPNAPSTYDPLGLENTIVNLPDVTFILGHVGQGDPTSVEHSLALAAKYPNVFLEISALNLPFIKDDHGHDIEPNTKELQLPIVLNEIRARRLVGKTLYGSDGPQAPGFLGDYMKQVKTEMGKAGYTDSEQKAVLGDNFRRVFFPSKP